MMLADCCSCRASLKKKGEVSVSRLKKQQQANIKKWLNQLLPPPLLAAAVAVAAVTCSSSKESGCVKAAASRCAQWMAR